ncbi:diiron oxygenase [Antrihabitans sp. YC2-6]|uniref:AurF N-oxygenase family protein n=1 Tax=Antrihabitans sp. YC2-6 TaxID=2799498 RepID=UPI0018F302D6|nr:diiron oxygenase [Antrihabitans sp. YC2-6]MBJ8344801.1 diiron oxygenase [Antrihabitans sp. YC2-6]
MTSGSEYEFKPAITAAGGAVRRRRHVGDRQLTARRLLFAASEANYDPDLDIDWDAAPDPDKDWLPAQRVSLYGTRLWHSLDDEQRRELGKHELVSMLSAGIYAQSILSMLMFRDIVEGDGLVDDLTRFTLASINDESRSTTMFSRLVNATGAAPYRLPGPLQRLTKLTLLAPTGPLGRGFRLLLEEMLDSVLRELAADPSIQPHVQQLTKIHVVAGARHIEFARDDLIRAIESHGPIANALHRWALAAVTAACYAVVVNPNAYRAVGINPVRGLVAALVSANYGRNARRATASFRRFTRDEGLLNGPVAGTILRLGRVG